MNTNAIVQHLRLLIANGGTLRAALAPLAASPSQAHPLRLPPRYGIRLVVWEGAAQKGGSVAVRSSLAGIPARSLLATASPPLRW